GRPARHRLDGLRPPGRRAAAQADRHLRRRRCPPAAADPASRRDASALRYERRPPRAGARPLRREGRGVRAPRAVPDARPGLARAQAWDGTAAAQQLLSAVWRLKRERNQKFGAVQVIDILLGKNTPKVTQFRHDSLSVFGIGKERSDTQWRAVVRQLLAQGLL